MLCGNDYKEITRSVFSVRHVLYGQVQLSTSNLICVFNKKMKFFIIFSITLKSQILSYQTQDQAASFVLIKAHSNQDAVIRQYFLKNNSYSHHSNISHTCSTNRVTFLIYSSKSKQIVTPSHKVSPHGNKSLQSLQIFVL